jgi:hypothetical protein
MGNPGFESQQGEDISLQNVQTGSETHPVSYSVGNEVLSLL